MSIKRSLDPRYSAEVQRGGITGTSSKAVMAHQVRFWLRAPTVRSCLASEAEKSMLSTAAWLLHNCSLSGIACGIKILAVHIFNHCLITL